jgi:hypothetical protein
VGERKPQSRLPHKRWPRTGTGNGEQIVDMNKKLRYLIGRTENRKTHHFKIDLNDVSKVGEEHFKV